LATFEAERTFTPRRRRRVAAAASPPPRRRRASLEQVRCTARPHLSVNTAPCLHGESVSLRIAVTEAVRAS
jgi:hypothetical protein